MNLGLILPLFSGDPEKVLASARESERLGYGGLFVFDHFFPPGASPDRPALEAFTTLAAVAEATERPALGTLVTRASLRPAGMLAKLASWFDDASGGRLIFGMGTGDPIDRREHEAYGIRMPGKLERREHLEETVRAVKGLFAGTGFDGGQHVPPLEGPLAPPSPRAGGPPVWIGAQADPVVRLAGTVADGWNGWGMNVETFRAKAGLLERAASEAGRTAEPTWAGIALVGEDEADTRVLLERRRARGLDDEAWVGTADELVSFLTDLAGAGATWGVVVLAGPADRRVLVAERVLPALRPAAVRE